MLDEALTEYESLINKQLEMLEKSKQDQRVLNRILDQMTREILDLVVNAATTLEKDVIPSALILEIVNKYINQLKELYK